MSPMPNGWSVDVEGRWVVVCVSGRPEGKFYLSGQEAWTLKNQLHLAHLIARRQQLAAANRDQQSEVESDTLSALIGDRLDLRRVEISEEERAELWARHRHRVKRYIDQLEHDAAHVDVGRVGHERAAQLPRGWSIEPADRLIRFVVPPSGVDGEFELTDVEALTAGVRLIQLSAIARSVRLAMEEAGE